MDYLFWAVVVFIVLIVLYWVLSRTYIFSPLPTTPDVDLNRLVDTYESFPTEVWFRNSPCFFEKYLCGSYRYIIYESNGRVVYDSRPDYPSGESAKEIRNSYEYINCISFLQAGVLRNRTANACFLAKIGNRYRIVHLSEYLYSERDKGF
jgi:hypothetical protein